MGSWILRVTTNLCLDRARQTHPIPLDPEITAVQPHEYLLCDVFGVRPIAGDPVGSAQNLFPVGGPPGPGSGEGAASMMFHWMERWHPPFR